MFISTTAEGKWFSAPNSRIADESEWPTTQLTGDTNTLYKIRSEVRKSETIFETTLHTGRTPVQPPFHIEISRYTTLFKLLRVTAICSLDKAILKRLPPHHSKIPVGDLLEAQDSWDKVVHQTEFAELHRHSKQNQPDPTIRSLGLILDQHDLIRCGGKIDNTALPLDAVTPKLVPSNHY